MATEISLLVITCSCLVVGIYFFFVRARPEEKAQQSQ
jgi:hypothetical protein